jgi:predicted lipase
MSNMPLACRLITASHLAYALPPDGTPFDAVAAVQPAIAAVGFVPQTLRMYQPPQAGGIRAFYYGETTQHEAIVTFRGTLPPLLAPGSNVFRIVLDWLNDGNIDLVRGQDLAGRVHKGFLEALDALWPGIEQLKLGDVVNRGTSLLLAGHSKGGALVYLAAYRLVQQGIPVTAAYSFAAPRAGDTAFASAFNQRVANVWRFEYQDDLVPHVPPATGAWLHMLRGMHLMHAMFPAEAPHLNLSATIAQDVERLVARLDTLAALPFLSYASAGTLQFINWDNGIEGDSLQLALKRNLHLAERMAELRFLEIAQDHFSDGGYMRVPCGMAPLAIPG